MTLKEFVGMHKIVRSGKCHVERFLMLDAKYASLSGTAQSPWLFCLYGIGCKRGILEKLQAKSMYDLFFSFFYFSV